MPLNATRIAAALLLLLIVRKPAAFSVLNTRVQAVALARPLLASALPFPVESQGGSPTAKLSRRHSARARSQRHHGLVRRCGADWARAANVLARLGREPGGADAHAYGALISCLGHARRGKHALEVLYRGMADVGVEPNAYCYRAALGACIQGLPPLEAAEGALQLLRNMRGRGVAPDLRIYNGALEALRRTGRWRAGMELLDEMAGCDGVQPDVVSCSTVVSACGESGACAEAVNLLNTMEAKYGAKPNAFTCSAAISACDKAGKWEEALRLLGTTEATFGVAPNLVCVNAAISACATCGQWQQALKLLGALRARNRWPEAGGPDVVSFAAALTALEKGAQGGLALKLLEVMEAEATEAAAAVTGNSTERNTARCSAAVAPNAFCYGAVITACARSADASGALALLARMESRGVEAQGAAAHNAALSACARAGRWRDAVAHLEAMEAATTARVCAERVGTQQNKTATTSATPRAPASTTMMQRTQADVPAPAVAASSTRRPGAPAPDMVTYSTVIDALDAAGEVDAAVIVLGRAQRRGLFRGASWTRTTGRVDLSTCSSGVARTVVRSLVRDMRESDERGQAPLPTGGIILSASPLPVTRGGRQASAFHAGVRNFIVTCDHVAALGSLARQHMDASFGSDVVRPAVEQLSSAADAAFLLGRKTSNAMGTKEWFFDGKVFDRVRPALHQLTSASNAAFMLGQNTRRIADAYAANTTSHALALFGVRAGGAAVSSWAQLEDSLIRWLAGHV